jgi:hypothetical protein
VPLLWLECGENNETDTPSRGRRGCCRGDRFHRGVAVLLLGVALGGKTGAARSGDTCLAGSIVLLGKARLFGLFSELDRDAMTSMAAFGNVGFRGAIGVVLCAVFDVFVCV